MMEFYSPHFQMYNGWDRSVLVMKSESVGEPRNLEMRKNLFEEEARIASRGRYQVKVLEDVSNIEGSGVYRSVSVTDHTPSRLLWPISEYDLPEKFYFDEKYLVRIGTPNNLTDECLTFYAEGQQVKSYKIRDLLRRQSYLRLFKERPVILDSSDPITAVAGPWFVRADPPRGGVFKLTTREGLDLEFVCGSGVERMGRLSKKAMIEDAQELLRGAEIYPWSGEQEH
jgi:hypothetical protein